MGETLAIESGKGKKSRRFEVALFSLMTADRYWSGSSRTAYRPIYLCYAGTDQAVRAFHANLRTGRQAAVRSKHGGDAPKLLEITSAAGLKWAVSKLKTGVTVMTGYLPELCELEVASLPERITFLFAPPEWWVEAQLAHPAIAALPEKIRRETVLGGYFCAFLDKRTPHPIVPDPLFHRRLYLAGRSCGWFNAPSGSPSGPGGFWKYPEEGEDGLAASFMVDVAHPDFDAVLAAETTKYFREESADWLLAPIPEPVKASGAQLAAPLGLTTTTETAEAVDALTELENFRPSPAIPDQGERADSARASAGPPPAPTGEPQEKSGASKNEAGVKKTLEFSVTQPEETDGETRIDGPGRILPHPAEPVAQLGLFDWA